MCYRVRSLQVSAEKGIESSHKGGLNSLELDSIDHRYLLGAASDASVAAYDVQVKPREALRSAFRGFCNFLL